MSHALIVVLFIAFASAAQARVEPSQSQIATYEGLHLAAQLGDVAEITRLAVADAYLNARDRNGRTPAHVAAFASNYDVLRALAEAEADMNALEDDIYDVLTIVAVANDPELVLLALDLGNRPDLATSVYDDTALIAAAHLAHHEAVHRLIK